MTQVYTHIVWEGEGAQIRPDSVVRPLFIGSEKECRTAAAELYELLTNRYERWQSVWVTVKPITSSSWLQMSVSEVCDYVEQLDWAV